MQRTRPPKKSESLEIRLSHPAKLAFMVRCRDEGRSASEVLRGLIEGYDGRRAARRRRALRLAAGAALAATVGAAALPSFARSGPEAEFARLDRDGDGAVSLAELSRGATVRLSVRAARVRVVDDADLAAQARLRALILRSLFDRFDSDRDGSISLDEYRQRHPAGPALIGDAAVAPAADGSPRSTA